MGAKPFADMFPDLVAGGPRDPAAATAEPVLTRISLQVGVDVLARFEAGGPDWPARMGAALRKAAGL